MDVQTVRQLMITVRITVSRLCSQLSRHGEHSRQTADDEHGTALLKSERMIVMEDSIRKCCFQ